MSKVIYYKYGNNILKEDNVGYYYLSGGEWVYAPELLKKFMGDMDEPDEISLAEAKKLYASLTGGKSL